MRVPARILPCGTIAIQVDSLPCEPGRYGIDPYEGVSKATSR